MIDPATGLALATTGLAATGICTAAALSGWRQWLELKRIELDAPAAAGRNPRSAAGRIELADLKERVRTLEAIANGIEI
jgi:hypothetical protein